MPKNQQNEFRDEWGNFAQIPHFFIQNSATLSNRGRWLFVLLRFYTNGTSGNAFPSYELLQEQTGWSFGTISAAIKDLEDTGWMTRQKGFGENTQYRLIRRDQFSAPLNNGVKAKKHTPPKNRVHSSKNKSPLLQKQEETKIELTKIELTQTEHEDLNHPKADDSRRESAPAVCHLFSPSLTPSNTETTDRAPLPVHVAGNDSFAPSSPAILPQVALFEGGGLPTPSQPVKTQKRAVSASGIKAPRVTKVAKLPPDPRATHPAIVACRDLTNRFPDKILWDKIIELVGDSPDVDRLKSCLMEHIERGFNKNSWKWVTEWYGAGIPQTNAKQKKERTYDSPFKHLIASIKSAEIAKPDVSG